MTDRKTRSQEKQVDNEAKASNFENDMMAFMREVREEMKHLSDQVRINNERGERSEKAMEEITKAIELCTCQSQEAVEATKRNSKGIQDLQAQLTKQQQINNQLEAKAGKLQDKVTSLEAHSRRDNLLIDGITEGEPDDVTSKVKHIFKTKLNLENVEDMKIVRCHRLGVRRRNAKQPRTVIIKFHWFGDRTAVWQARKNLKGSNIFIKEDFPKEIEDKRRILRPVLQKALSSGKEAFLNVDTLIIDKMRYTVNDLSKLPRDLHPENIATVELGNMLLFFGGQSPLSNFYKSTFEVQGQNYDWVEQFYVASKADYANDKDAKVAVMSAKSPQECKRISEEIDKKIDKKVWLHDKARDVMLKGISAKFTQNKHCGDFLMNTSDKELVEANKNDDFWSCGLDMKKDQAKILEHKWHGTNHLGKIIMEVRDNLKS